ncbi:MAG: Hpt domain-containing protein [Terracidiphilus sp.]|jgi:HPt (histidine-containing phosphotransfer) domain-containing protein
MDETDSIRQGTASQLNEAEILARLDGDCQLLADLCDLSLSELPGMIHLLVEAVRGDDANAVHRAAHRLKGALSLFGAGAHIEDCLTLEALALQHDLSQAPAILAELEKHLGEFSAAVTALGREIHARADCG